MILGKDNIERLPHDMVKTLEALLRDETPRVAMTKELGPYQSVRERKDSLYALLVSAGYLKVVCAAVWVVRTRWRN